AEVNDSTVIICSRHIKQAKRAVTQIKGKAFAAEVDLTNDSSVKQFIQQVLDNHKRIDILINNAGYPFDKNIWYKKFHEVSNKELDRIIEVDLKGSARLAREVIPLMLQNNYGEDIDEIKTKKGKRQKRTDRIGLGGGGGVIINISSTPAIAGHTKGSPYTIAKAANIALTKCISKEYGANNIRAYSLALGNIATAATYESMTKEDRDMATQEPSMKRWGRPEEVAKVAACIADDNFSFVTGNTIIIDGGNILL
ncbi:MAG TPA: SDR family oxidoreductase, partial [Candidatus Nitrosocosmicus sp.]|nr:SDR family oxidoreductase [Candidatus Nitrosocosmicus sp.]